MIGTFRRGDFVEVEVLPFRACLLRATSGPPELGLRGCDYEVVRDVPGKPVLIRLLALPGEAREVELIAGGKRQNVALRP